MSDIFDRVSSYVQGLVSGPVPQLKSVLFPPNRLEPPGFAGTPIQRDKAYLTLTINELFLADARSFWATYQPMVLVSTEYLYGGKKITVPAVVGPSLLTQPEHKLPQGLLINDVKVAGPVPYRGDELTVTVLLYGVQHTNHARGLLRVVESISKGIGGTADFNLYTKVAGALLEGLETLIGLDDTRPIMGQRVTLSPVRPGGFRTFYAALIAGAFPDSEFSVENPGRLRVGLEPGTGFTAADYVLYSLSAPSRRTDEEALPFYPMFQRALGDAFRGGEKDWNAAKATFSEVWQQIRLSPDLTSDQAEELYKEWETRLLKEKERGERVRMLSVGPSRDRAPRDQAEEARVQRAASILSL